LLLRRRWFLIRSGMIGRNWQWIYILGSGIWKLLNDEFNEILCGLVREILDFGRRIVKELPPTTLKIVIKQLLTFSQYLFKDLNVICLLSSFREIMN
jgi:hypothetical protein